MICAWGNWEGLGFGDLGIWTVVFWLPGFMPGTLVENLLLVTTHTFKL